MKALIFAAGLGTRLKPITNTLPKALVPLNGQTLLAWQILRLKAAGITDMVVNVHHFPDLIIDYLRQNDNFGCRIAVSDERDCLLETGGGLRFARSLLTSPCEEPILACNVDIVSNIDLRALMAAYNPNELGVLVVSQRDTQRYLLFDQTLRLCGWTNIATGETRPSHLSPLTTHHSPFAFSGMQILSPRIFDCMDVVVAEKGDKFSLIDLYLTLTQKEILRAYIPENYRMMDVGKIDQLPEAERFAATLGTL